MQRMQRQLILRMLVHERHAQSAVGVILQKALKLAQL